VNINIYTKMHGATIKNTKKKSVFRLGDAILLGHEAVAV
jgi:hypothetical protein